MLNDLIKNYDSPNNLATLDDYKFYKKQSTIKFYKRNMRIFLKKEKLIISYKESHFLKLLKENDVTPKYVRWLNDYEIVKYTEQRHFFKDSLQTVKDFVEKKIIQITVSCLESFMKIIILGILNLGQ